MKTKLWFIISCFGIMFAILSWVQEMGLLFTEPGWHKGAVAVLSGLILYFFIFWESKEKKC